MNFIGNKTKPHRYRNSDKPSFKKILKLVIIIAALIFLIILALLIFEYSLDQYNKEDIPQTTNNSTYIEPVAQDISSFDFGSYNLACDWRLVVVNKYNEIPDNYNPNLCEFYDKTIDSRIKNDLEALISDAKKDNIDIWISSGYRSFDEQTSLFDAEVLSNITSGYDNVQALSLAERLVARPRKSEHHTGLAIDINGVQDSFKDTDAFKWMCSHCYDYGFILRYPEEKSNITGINFEPWHFRYVGVYHAKAIKNLDMCLEEYVYSLIK